MGRLYNPAFTSPRSMRHIADKVHSEGYDIELPCKATGMQPLTYTWFVNGVRFKRKYRLNVKNAGSTLKIQRLRARDAAVYTCIASNKFGNLSFSYPLRVQGMQMYFKLLCYIPKAICFNHVNLKNESTSVFPFLPTPLFTHASRYPNISLPVSLSTCAPLHTCPSVPATPLILHLSIYATVYVSLLPCPCLPKPYSPFHLSLCTPPYLCSLPISFPLYPCPSSPCKRFWCPCHMLILIIPSTSFLMLIQVLEYTNLMLNPHCRNARTRTKILRFRGYEKASVCCETQWWYSTVSVRG